jgi:hypothetical protein
MTLRVTSGVGNWLPQPSTGVAHWQTGAIFRPGWVDGRQVLIPAMAIKRRNPDRYDIPDTIPGLVTRSAGGTGPLPFEFVEGSARTVSDGSSTDLPKKELGTCISSPAVGLRRRPKGHVPYAITILLEVSRTLRHAVQRRCCMRDDLGVLLRRMLLREQDRSPVWDSLRSLARTPPANPLRSLRGGGR